MDQDAALVTAFHRGDERAFDVVFQRHKRGVYNLAYRTVGAELAEDVMQEVFIQVYKSLGRFRSTGSFRAWIYGITLNVCRDSKRRHNRRRTIPYDDAGESIPDESDPSDIVQARWMYQQVEIGMLSLREDERLAVELHYLQGLSYRELSEVLHCSTGTIKARVHHAVCRLRQLLLPSIAQEEK
ncbi:MAG: RNA polymerase sigma factor [Armatimonadota bacterium]|nr:RNA polymerase sigma factor [Armatimonadota bacterium]